MSIRGLKKMALLLTFWVAMQSGRLNAQTISGNVVTSNLTVTGSNIYMGEQTSTTNPGWGEIYTDGPNSTVEFEATRGGNTWYWQQNNGAIVQMTLDNTNTVTLYNSSGTPEITLNPTGTSTFASSVVIDGTNNTMPNQTLTGSSSVLTEGLGDSRYLSSSAITGTGTDSVEMGYQTTASGNFSTAMGDGTTASGIYSTAMGNGTIASGTGSTAMEGGTTASGAYSTAMGQSTKAQALDVVAIGRYNVGGATSQGRATGTGWYATDPLFEIGNGTSTDVTSDAFVVYKNGNTAVQGSLSAGGPITTSGSITTSGTITAAGIITAAPGGSVPMYSGE